MTDQVEKTRFRCRKGLFVNGLTTLSGAATIDGNTLIDGDLTVTGATNINVTLPEMLDIQVAQISRHSSLVNILPPHDPITIDSSLLINEGLQVTQHITWPGGGSQDQTFWNSAYNTVQTYSGSWNEESWVHANFVHLSGNDTITGPITLEQTNVNQDILTVLNHNDDAIFIVDKDNYVGLFTPTPVTPVDIQANTRVSRLAVNKTPTVNYMFEVSGASYFHDHFEWPDGGTTHANSVYNTVSSNSADWNLTNSVYNTVSSNSARWDSTLNDLSTSATGWNSTWTTVSSNSSDWDETYTTVTDNSAAWSNTNEQLIQAGKLVTDHIQSTCLFGGGPTNVGVDSSASVYDWTRTIPWSNELINAPDTCVIESVGSGRWVIGTTDSDGLIYYSNDDGDTWLQPMTPPVSASDGITDIVNGNNDWVFAGTRVTSNDPLSAGLLHVSYSNGLHWTVVDQVTAGSDRYSSINTIAMMNDNSVIVGANSGDIWTGTKTQNNWNTWTKNTLAGVTEVKKLHHIKQGILLAVVQDNNLDTHLYRSIDFGVNWYDLGLTDGTATTLDNQATDVTHMISYTHGEQTYVYVATTGTNGVTIQRSLDLGLSWYTTYNPSGNVNDKITGLEYIYNNQLAASVVLATGTKKLIRSVDGGATWYDWTSSWSTPVTPGQLRISNTSVIMMAAGASTDGVWTAMPDLYSGDLYDPNSPPCGPITLDGDILVTGSMTISGDLVTDVDYDIDSTGFIDTNLTVNGSLCATQAEFVDDVHIRGNLTVDGNVWFNAENTHSTNSIYLGDDATDSVIFYADIGGNLIPDNPDTYDIGTTHKHWRNAYIKNLTTNTLNWSGGDTNVTSDGVTANYMSWDGGDSEQSNDTRSVVQTNSGTWDTAYDKSTTTHSTVSANSGTWIQTETTTTGTSAINKIVAVDVLPTTQQPGVLYLVMGN